MARRSASVPDAWFEALYQAGGDPWRVATSAYERDKYAATLAALGPGRIGRAWEAGCGIGVFTRMLAGRCTDLLATDAAENALAQARARCADAAWVRLQILRIPQQWPAGRFDLMLFSELLYYFSTNDRRRTADAVAASLAPAGRVLLVHWTGETDYPCSGDDAAEQFIADTGGRLVPVLRQRHECYRLDLLRRV